MSRILAFLFVSLVLASGPAAMAQPAVESRGGDFVAEDERSFSVEPGGRLELDSRAGSIHLQTWDQNTVKVQESIRMDGLDRDEAETYVQSGTAYEQSGNTLSIETPKGDGNAGSWWGGRPDVQHDFVVTLPRRFSAEVSTSGGSIEAENMEGRLEARTAGGSIDVRTVTGPVSIRTAGGSLSARSIDGDLDGRTAGGSIDARDVTGIVDVRTAGGSIRVENAGDRVDASTAGGSVDVRGAAGSVLAKTSGGDVEVRDAQQDVEARTSGGDIELDGIGGRLEARTSGGDIEGRDLRGPVEARTSAGDIELENVQAGVDAETSVGDIEISFALDPSATGYASTLETSHGDIRIVLPSNLPATLEAEVESIHGRVDRADIYSDFPVTRESNDDILRATGTLNGGGPVFDLLSRGGSIRIEKAEE